MKKVALILAAFTLGGCQLLQSRPAFEARVEFPLVPGACLWVASDREYPEGLMLNYNIETGLLTFGTRQAEKNSDALEAFKLGVEAARDLVPVP